jgi:hypothetical protein
VPHPGRFTDEFVFRRCTQCGERNLVRDGDFFFAICDAGLPDSWNFGNVVWREEWGRGLNLGLSPGISDDCRSCG